MIDIDINIKNSSEHTSSISNMAYSLENAMHNGVTIEKLKKQFIFKKNHNNLQTNTRIYKKRLINTMK
ncbi:hypothetical protein GTN31_08730 [Macrococcoides canis]|uniref:hypothetical protein n=1 Tax=Macrococcoides canis TaxID=1855823 RepID=UPI0013E95E7D|nr:hypothetical protein [Macrococcus canis]QIH76444.1 hypothetical protein GTN31_08730 [Macrococcus canis]